MQRTFIILLLAACFACGSARAVCTSPAGNEADVIYNGASHAYQFCNNTNWVAFGGALAAGGGAGCTSPAGVEGDKIYSNDYHTYQYCNGTSWISMTEGNSVGGGGGAGCTSPVGKEADLIFNGTYTVYQFCNGTNWVAMGPLGGSSYTGPGDLISGATAWYGLRGYNGAVAATGSQKAINIRRASDNTMADILILTSGALDVATASTFCASTSCYVTKWYDQSGNGYDVSQATAGNQPQLVFNCDGSLPCVQFVATSDQGLNTTTGPSIGVASTSSVALGVSSRSATQAIVAWAGSGGGYQGVIYQTTANSVGLRGSVVISTAADNFFHSIEGAWTQTTGSIMYADGSSVSGTTAANGTGNYIALGERTDGGSNWLNGNIGETGIWSGATFTTTQMNTLCTNQNTYWGIAGCGNYLGPGDIVSGATAWYGLRAYSAAVAATGTQKAINIRRASDSTTTDILILTTGALDVATASTFCASTTCYATKWYDQSGNGNDVAQATTADQPQLVFSCIGSLPCLSFNNTIPQYLRITTASATLGVASVTAVAERIGNTSANNNILSWGASSSSSQKLQFGTSASTIAINAAATLSSVADNSMHAIQGVYTGTTNTFVYADGASASGTTSAPTTGTVIAIGHRTDVGASPLDGYVSETGIWNGVSFTTTQVSNMCHNQYSYWGTVTVC